MRSSEKKSSVIPRVNPDASRKVIRSLKSQYDNKRKISEIIADFMTVKFGSITFLIVHFLWFSWWILANESFFPSIQPFDPFPYGLLTMVVSLEAIGLSIIVLISQNRSSKIYALREEADLQIDMINEEETTKALHLLVKILEKKGINWKQDKDLRFMLKPTEFKKIEALLAKQV